MIMRVRRIFRNAEDPVKHLLVLLCAVIKVNGNYNTLIHPGLLMAMNLRNVGVCHPSRKRTITRDMLAEERGSME